MRIRRLSWMVVVAFAGCATPTPDAPSSGTPPPVAPPTAARETAAPAADPDPWVAKNCIEGMPVLSPGLQAEVRVIRRRGYVLAHSSIRKEPLWVSEGIPQDQLDGPAKRRDNFKPDPELPEGERSELADYKGSGFDRGHQAPAEDMTKDQDLMDESFYLSNMCPQVGQGFNQQIWASLEAWARDEIRGHGGGWVITGPLFLDEEGKTIGPNGVAVPSHFFKVVIVKGQDGDLQAIAFVLENRKFSSDDAKHLERYIHAIDWVEQKAGLDVMPDLPAAEEERLERRAAEMWN